MDAKRTPLRRNRAAFEAMYDSNNANSATSSTVTSKSTRLSDLETIRLLVKLNPPQLHDDALVHEELRLRTKLRVIRQCQAFKLGATLGSAVSTLGASLACAVPALFGSEMYRQFVKHGWRKCQRELRTRRLPPFVMNVEKCAQQTVVIVAAGVVLGTVLPIAVDLMMDQVIAEALQAMTCGSASSGAISELLGGCVRFLSGFHAEEGVANETRRALLDVEETFLDSSNADSDEYDYDWDRAKLTDACIGDDTLFSAHEVVSCATMDKASVRFSGCFIGDVDDVDLMELLTRVDEEVVAEALGEYAYQVEPRKSLSSQGVYFGSFRWR